MLLKFLDIVITYNPWRSALKYVDIHGIFSRICKVIVNIMLGLWKIQMLKNEAGVLLSLPLF